MLDLAMGAPAAPDERVARRLQGWSRRLGLGAFALGSLLVAAGALCAGQPAGEFLQMRLKVALAALLAGFSLSMRHLGGRRSGRIAGLASGGLVAFIGVSTLVEYLSGHVLSPFEAVFLDVLSVPTATILMLLGAGLLLLHRDAPPAAVETCALGAGFLAMLAIVGHLFHVEELVDWTAVRHIRLHTAALLELIALGLLVAQPSVGTLAQVTADLPGGRMARRLLPLCAVAPLGVGLLALGALKSGRCDVEVAMAFTCTTLAVGSAAITWSTARSLNRSALELRTMAERVTQAEKLEATATLAGGAAHHFNNSMTVIVAGCELIRMGAQDDGLLDDIVASAQRAAGLTRQLLMVARSGRSALGAVNVGALVAELRRDLGDLVPPTALVDVLVDSRLPAAHADPEQLADALRLLVRNAVEAMPGGGALTITATTVELTAAEIVRDRLDLEPGPHVALAVSDTGVGIPAHVRARLFEPFFTTKGLALGTGLGLAATYGLLRQWGGDIQVRSKVGRGSTFRLLLVPESITGYSRGSASGGACRGSPGAGPA